MNAGILLSVALGGAAGAVARYLASEAVQRYAASAMPWGTFAVNIAGALAIGICWGAAQQAAVSPTARAAVMTGFLGAFTTFSTFSLETMHLLGRRQYVAGAGYMLGSCALGLAACFVGLRISRAALR
jgi:fluoride exporter